MRFNVFSRLPLPLSFQWNSFCFLSPGYLFQLPFRVYFIFFSNTKKILFGKNLTLCYEKIYII